MLQIELTHFKVKSKFMLQLDPLKQFPERLEKEGPLGGGFYRWPIIQLVQFGSVFPPVARLIILNIWPYVDFVNINCKLRKLEIDLEQ